MAVFATITIVSFGLQQRRPFATPRWTRPARSERRRSQPRQLDHRPRGPGHAAEPGPRRPARVLRGCSAGAGQSTRVAHHRPVRAGRPTGRQPSPPPGLEVAGRGRSPKLRSGPDHPPPRRQRRRQERHLRPACLRSADPGPSQRHRGLRAGGDRQARFAHRGPDPPAPAHRLGGHDLRPEQAGRGAVQEQRAVPRPAGVGRVRRLARRRGHRGLGRDQDLGRRPGAYGLQPLAAEPLGGRARDPAGLGGGAARAG